MLRITSINPTGIFSYGETDTIDLDQCGTVSLVGVNQDAGGSNGSGKSSLFNAICELLFGDNPTGISGPSVANHILGGMCARIEFLSWENVPCRVTACRDWKPKDYYPKDCGIEYCGTDLFFERHLEGGWLDCRGKSMIDTRKKIVEAVGMGYETFLSLSYLAGRSVNSLLSGTNKERQEILKSIAKVDDWDQVLKRGREEKKSISTELNQLRQELARETGICEQLTKQVESFNASELQAQKASCEASIVQANSSLKVVEAANVGLDLSLAEIKKSSILTLLEQEQNQLKDDCSVTRLAYTSYVSLICPNDIKELQSRVDALFQISLKAEAQYKAYKELRQPLIDSSQCPMCGSTLSKDHSLHIKSDLEESETLAINCKRDYETLNNEFSIKLEEHKRIKEEKSKQLLALMEEAQRLLDAKVKECEAEKTRVSREENDIFNQRQQLLFQESSLKKDIATWQGMITAIESQLNSWDHYRSELEAKKTLVGSLKEDSSALEDNLDTLEWLIDNIPYVKSYKMSVQAKNLEMLVNEHLSAMGDSARVSISMFDEKKSKKGASLIESMKSEVNIKVIDGEKEIDPKLCSDGELRKLSNAVVRSLRDISKSTGASCNLLMMDEVFSFIDHVNSQAMIDDMKFDGVDTVIVTDNSGRAENLMIFDEVWYAKKHYGLTTLEV